MRKLNDKRARRFDAIWTSFSSELSNYDNWIYAINNINTDGVACARCRRAWIASVCCPYPSRQPITSEFKSILFECESFGSLLARLALKPHPSLHQSHCRVCAGIINWSCLLASARFPGSWGPRGPQHGPSSETSSPACWLLVAVSDYSWAIE